MATVLTNDANYTAIADAIRAKGGEGTFTPAQMATAIANLPSGGANKVLTSAIITGTSSTIDISNYVEDDNFILFFGIDYASFDTNYVLSIYTPSIPGEMNSSTIEYGGFILSRDKYLNMIELSSLGLLQLYTNTGMHGLASIDYMSRSYLTYSNGIITAKDSSHPFATSSILIYLAEATT